MITKSLMKFGAILKDSLRETLDVKLLYFLVGLSVLVVLFIAGITYKPLSMEPKLERATKSLTRDGWIFRLVAQVRQDADAQKIIPIGEVKDLERTDAGDPDKPWTGDYRFFVNVKLLVDERDSPFEPAGEKVPKPEDIAKNMKQYDAAKRRLSEPFMQALCSDSFNFLKDVKVKSVPSDQVDEARFEVRSSGTMITAAKEWSYKPYLFFGLVPFPDFLLIIGNMETLGDIIDFIGTWIIGTFGAGLAMFLSTIMTASFLPTMMAKGTVDLLIVKPIHRTTLFLYKFVGGLLFMFLNTLFIMVAIWLTLGLRTGLWVNSFLLCVLIYTFEFALFYALSALIAVLTRSAILCILGAVALWGFLWILGWAHYGFIERPRETASPEVRSHWAYVGFDVVHMVMPHYDEIDWMTCKMIRTELAKEVKPEGVLRDKELEALDKRYNGYDWTSSLLITSAYIVVMIGLACWRFATKDY